jgi:hypothetical protein
VARDIAAAQTFTVGTTGTLVGLDLFIGRFGANVGPLLVDLRSTKGGVPTEDDRGVRAHIAIASTTFPNTGFGGAVDGMSIDLSALGLSVVAGQMLAFVVRSPDSVPTPTGSPQYALVGSTASYAGGAAFYRAPSLGVGSFTPVPSSAFDDYAFRTFVDSEALPEPAPVSEPATVLLMGSCLAGLAYARFKRRPSRSHPWERASWSSAHTPAMNA